MSFMLYELGLACWVQLHSIHGRLSDSANPVCVRDELITAMLEPTCSSWLCEQLKRIYEYTSTQQTLGRDERWVKFSCVKCRRGTERKRAKKSQFVKSQFVIVTVIAGIYHCLLYTSDAADE